MAINNPLENRFEGDDFILTITINDLTSLSGFKAEFKVYDQDPDSFDITEKLKKTTSGHFTPNTGGITFEDNKVLVSFSRTDFSSAGLSHNTPYFGRLVLYDASNHRAVSSTGRIQWNKHPNHETLSS